MFVELEEPAEPEEPAESEEAESEEEELVPFYDGEREPDEREPEPDQRGPPTPREPLESEPLDSPGTHTLPHTISARTAYPIVTNERSIERQAWQLKARITCNKRVFKVNTTLSLSNKLPSTEQEAMANTHLDFLILEKVTVKRRNKKPKAATNATTPRRSSRSSGSTPSPPKFIVAKPDGRSSNSSMLGSPHGRPGTAINTLHLQKTLSDLKRESQADKRVIERLQHHISNLQQEGVYAYANE